MAGPLQQQVNAVVLARGEEQERAFNALQQAIRTSLVTVMVRNGVPLPDAEDEAQERTGALAAKVCSNAVTRADAYVGRSGRNAAKDWHRRPKGPPVVPMTPEELARVSRVDPRSEEDAISAMAAALAEVMADPQMPPAHREILVRIYLAGVPVDELARADLERQPLDRDGRPRTMKMACANIYQRVGRARDWVRVRAVPLAKRG